jgi:hypothetical protein
VEEGLIVVLQFLVEGFAQMPWDLFWYREPKNPNRVPAGTIGFASLVAGASVAGVSLAVFPNALTRSPEFRVAQLAAVPFFAGFTGWTTAKLFQRKRGHVTPAHHFWWSLLFSLGFVAVRFAFAKRP